MRYGNELLGLEVKLADTDRVIGQVKDIIVSRARKCVVGLLLQEANWLQKAKFIPCSHVQALTDGAVVIPDEESVENLESVSDGIRQADHNEFLGTPLFSANGHEFGRIADVCFNEHTGELDGFSIWTGTAPDAFSGPVFLPFDDGVAVRKDVVIVDAQAADRLMFEATEVGRLDPANRPQLQQDSSTHEHPDNSETTDSFLRQSFSTTLGPFDEKLQILLTSIAGLWQGLNRT